VATITGANFANCHGDIGSAVGCTVTATGTNFPWRVTAVTTTDIEIHGLDIDTAYETTPGTLNECANNGLRDKVTAKKVTGTTFTPMGRGYHWGVAHGVVVHVGGITTPAVMRGFGTGTGLLNVLD
jgi:hypothetical protein